MTTELQCPACDCDIELSHDAKAVECPHCQAALVVDVDAEFTDGMWRDLTKLRKVEK